jgi:maleate isomerase/arylmalonate decarboxylase
MIPPGAPTVEMEAPQLVPPGVSVHFTRMDASEGAGTPRGQEERNRRQAASVEECARLLAMVKPSVIGLAHTATSYTIGAEEEAALTRRIEKNTGCRFITAFGSSLAALRHLGVRRIGLSTPYSEEITLIGKAHIEKFGFEVVSYAHLENCPNLYDETPGRAYTVARRANAPDADAIFMSGVGLPTLPVIQQLEDDLKKPVVCATGCMIWYALRISGVDHRRPGFGSLFAN